jgi:hypothetical protein
MKSLRGISAEAAEFKWGRCDSRQDTAILREEFGEELSGLIRSLSAIRVLLFLLQHGTRMWRGLRGFAQFDTLTGRGSGSEVGLS